ncbi:MAG: conjugal transfer protein TrbE [Hyphomonadaceae bacterium]
MLNLSEYARKPTCLADHLPWACLVAPGVILNKDGSFQKTYRYRGPDLESATRSELVTATARVNNALRRFGSGWALFFEAARRETSDYPAGDFPNAASWLVDQERRLRMEEDGTAFESHYYLTLLWLPPADTAGRAEQILIETPTREVTTGWRDRLEMFELHCNRAFDMLAGCLTEIDALSDDESLTYLHSCISSKAHEVQAPELPVFLDSILSDEPLTGGLKPILGEAHIRTLTILGFPTSTLPGLLDSLNREGFSYRWATRFIAMDKAQAETVLKRKRRLWFSKRKSIGAVVKEMMFNEQAALTDNDAGNKAADADAALQELGADLVSYGYITTTVTVSDIDPVIADAKLRAAEKVFTTAGFTVIQETLNAVEAWLGSLPGHVYANVRQPILHTLNLAHMTPLSAVWAGEQHCPHLEGPALLQAHTDGTTPFRLNLHQGDVGHTLIVGPTGAGKSVLLAFLAMQWQRYTGAQIIMFDRGRSARAVTHALQGSHIALGSDDAPSLQPLKDIDHPENAAITADWVAGLCANEGLEMTPEDREAIWAAIQSLASAPQSERTLTGLTLLLQSIRIREALMPYTLDGPHGRLLDADHDELSLGDTVCFEMEDLMAAPSLIAPVMTHLFHRLESRFDGRPTLLILDEAWLFLDNPMFAARIRDWLKTLRKKNVSVIFATQSLADITESEIAPAIIENCLTRIFLPNERASEPQQTEAYTRFGLNARQIDILVQATPKQDYYYHAAKGARLFELGLGPIALSFCGASSPSDQKRMDETLAKFGTVEFAAGFLSSSGLEWASELISGWPGADQSPTLLAAE